MYKNINVEAEHNELILENSNGDKVIIPANKRNWVKQKLSEGCHGCIDSLVETLPVVNNYAQDGTVFPNEKQPIVLITPSGRKVETDTDSDFYRAHYNSKLIGKQNEDKSWNLTDEIYQGKPLPEVVVVSKIQPNTFADYNNQFNKNNPKDKFLQKKQEEHNKEFYSAPSWAQQAVGGYNDKRKQNDLKRDNEEYTRLQNDFIAEKLLKRNPKVGSSNNERLAWYNSLSEKERDIVNNSYSADKFSPAVRAYMESQSNEAKKYGILETFRDVDKLAQSVEGTPERFRIFPNAENNYENYVNPLMWIGDMAKGLGNVPKDIKEENYLKAAGSVASPLLVGALGGLGAKTTGQFIKNTFLPLGGLEENVVKGGKNLVGLVGKLSKADKVIDATKVGSKVLNKTDDAVNNINRIKFDDFKNDNEFFRVIVGDEAFDDIVQTQKIRTKQPSSVKNTPPNTINLDRRGSTAFPSFSKGSPSLSYANDNPNHYIIRTADESIKPSTSGRHGKGTTMFPTDKSGKHLTELDASKVQVYKHIGNGEYELVDVTEAGSKMLNKTDDVVKQAPKQLPGSGNVDDVGSLFKGTLTDKEKEMYRWFEKQQKLDALPKTTNKKTLGVLEDFKTRIQTPEGKKRMKELGIDSDKMLQKIQIVEDPNTFGYFSGDRNRVVLNPLDPLPTQTARHEIEHGVQNAFRDQAIKNEGKIIPTLKRLVTDPLLKKPLPKSITDANTKIDDLLSGLELRKQGTPNKQWIGHVEQDSPVDISEYKSLISNKQNATDYFLTGSEGREKSAFLGEVQQYMMDNNIIPKTSYIEVTPEMVKNTFIEAMFDETGGGKYLRLFNIMKPSEANYKLISKGLNKMLGLIPPAAVIGTATQSQNQNKSEQ